MRYGHKKKHITLEHFDFESGSRCGVLRALTWKRTSHYNVWHFSGVRTAKIGSKPRCFALLFGNAFHAAAVCTFSASELPKVVLAPCVLHVFSWKCTSRRNDTQFFDI